MNEYNDNTVLDTPVIMIYPPLERSLKEEYPELASVEEFKDMNPRDVQFTWFYAVFFRNLPDHERRLNSYKHSWGEIPNRKKAELQNGIFPGNILAAIKKWNTYDVPMRTRASFIMNEAVANMEKIIYGLSEDADADEKKKYVDMAKSIIELLPKIIEQKESGFGIRVVTPRALLNNKSFIDEYQNEKAAANNNAN